MVLPSKLDVDDFDDAARKMLHVMLFLESYLNRRAKSFSFGGWCGHGIGASPILTATAELLKSERIDIDTRKHFGKIIHVDCSIWKNRRAMQRRIAEELNLGHLMYVFDNQDEDDDFRGIDINSRVEIPSIGNEINVSLRNETFLMILHYGGEEDIDLAECGIPNPEFGTYSLGKLLWTGYGRFQVSEREYKLKSNSAYSEMIELYPNINDHMSKLLLRSLHEEAAEVIGYTGFDDLNPRIVLDSFLYLFFLTEQQHGKPINVDHDWDTHACNYWICDGILQGDRCYEVGSALYGVIQTLGHPSNRTNTLARFLKGHREQYAKWVSISIQLGAHDITTVPANASSYFLTFGEDGNLQLPYDLFQLAINLRVLKLCKCSFDFASPPFRCCHNLRLLLLDNCINIGDEQGGGPCLPNLLVLDIRCTEFVFLTEIVETMSNLREINTKGVSWRNISHSWKKLCFLHKLRVTKSMDMITVDNCPSIDMINLELLDFSANIHMESLPAMSSAGSLKMLVLDGCSSLQYVALEGSHPLLESFSFDGYGQAEKWTHPIQLPKKELRPKSHSALVPKAKVRRISLEGCARLHHIFLRALPNLEELDLSGTAIETLDLGSMDVPRLKKLFLLGCETLRCLLWDGRNPSLEVLHVDTRGKTGSSIYFGEQRSSVLGVLMAFTDGRFIWSVIRGLYMAWYGSMVHVHISSKIHSEVNIIKTIEEIGPSQQGLVPTWPFSSYIDIVLRKDIVMCSSLVWGHRQLYPLDVHIEIGEGSHHLEVMNDSDDFKFFIQNKLKSLHVHDNTSITVILPGASRSWSGLKWCHVERCPKLHTFFPRWDGFMSFESIRILSAFDLLIAYCIWDRGILYHWRNFEYLEHIYLHNCPRLVFVLPISFTLPSLETIHIAYCPNLQHIFPLDDKYPQDIASGVTFKKLKHIKLYHLHRLEQICGSRRLTAPVLETISLRDCWGLRRLPAVSRRGAKPVVDCEKDWWDRLEWDCSNANHEPSLFETRHSAYYKKTIPRVSVLR